MKFLDEAKIYVESGAGGPGCTAFRREKYVEFGGPNGGDGGRGGDLIDFRYRQHFRARRGRPGEGKGKTGAAGESLVIRVPVGTQVLDETKSSVLADLTRAGERKLLARGGDGGFGNSHYKSATNQAPRRSDPGWPGEGFWVWLRLKLIADAGLVGLPNAGKSTFLAAASHARPKIADYPFTTLAPGLGVVEIDDRSFVLADIPGLIEGAHEGAGLGDRFLGHVERCGVLLHLVDGTQEDPGAAYRTVRAELEAYGAGLADKPEIVALNKIDALTAEVIEARAALLEAAVGAPVARVSAAAGTGVRRLLGTLWQEIEASRSARTEDRPAAWQPLDAARS